MKKMKMKHVGKKAAGKGMMKPFKGAKKGHKLAKGKMV